MQQIPLSRKENQILLFLQENRPNLQQAFATDAFFPGLSWDDAVRLLLTELTDQILGEARVILDNFLEKVNHPDLKEHFTPEGGIGIDSLGFRDYVLELMRNKKLRDQYLNVFAAIQGKFYERYVPKVIDYRKLIYIELVRRDHLNMAPDIVGDYCALASLFRPLAFREVDTSEKSGDILVKHGRGSRGYHQVFGRIKAELLERGGIIPDSVLLSGLEGALNVLNYPEISGTARLVHIFSSRAQEFVPNLKLDRGAESPDKSWFHIHRRTAKQTGLDARFLEELYLIAGEEGW